MFAQADCVYAACALKVYRRSLSPATLLVFSFLASSTLSLFLPPSPAISFAKIFLVSALKFHWSACRLCKHGSLLFLRSSIYSRVLQRIYAAAASSLCVCVSASRCLYVYVCVWAFQNFDPLMPIKRSHVFQACCVSFYASRVLHTSMHVMNCLSFCLPLCLSVRLPAW